MKKPQFYFPAIILYIAFLFGCPHIAYAQLITTIAGTGGPAGLSGDEGPAMAAQLNGPDGMKRDASGNLYFADDENNRIRKIDPAGIITTIAGSGGTGIAGGYSGDGGPATAAKLYEPHDLAFDITGNMYIADWSNQCIRKVGIAGTITTFAGTAWSTGGYSGDGAAATAASLYNPAGVTVDTAGNVYISDFYNYRIRKVNTEGVIITIAGNGTPGYTGDGGPATAAFIGSPSGIIIDSIGAIFFADETNSVIRKIDTTGIITTIAGTGTSGLGADGISATSSALNYPHYLAFDNTGNLFFSDAGNNRVRKINTSGIISTVAGNSIRGYYGDDSCAATYAEFSSPTGIAVDGAGSVYIADEINNRIRKTIPDHAPAFIGGHTQHWAVCRNTGGTIDTILTITDTDHGQTETWSLLSPPLHGVAAAAYSAASTGAALTPAGLTYTPTTGYNGNDTFTVVINDCANGADTTTIYISVDTFLNVGALSGADSVCIAAAPITLTDTVPGGAWHSSNASAAVSGGMVTGLTVGVDTVFYIVSNACGSDTAQYVVAVSACPSRVASPQPAPREREVLSVSPNPTDGAFTFSLSATVDEDVQVVITNVVGEKVKEFTTATNKQIPIMLDAPAGVYFLSASTTHGRWSGKIIITN